MSYKFAYCFCNWDYTLAKEVTGGVNSFLSEHEDVQVMCFHEMGKYGSSDSGQNLHVVFDLAEIGLYDGYLIQGNEGWPLEERESLIRRLRSERNVPIVTIVDRFEDCMYVGTDERTSEDSLISALINRIWESRERGSSRFFRGRADQDHIHAAFAPARDGLEEKYTPEKGQQRDAARERLFGFLDACRKNGIGKEHVRILSSAVREEDGIRVAEELLKNPENMPNLLAFSSEDPARAAMKTFEEAGVHIPDDLVIASFENPDQPHYYDNDLFEPKRDDRRMIIKGLELLYAAVNGRGTKQEVFVSGRSRYDDSLEDGTPYKSATADQLREELLETNRKNVLLRNEERNYDLNRSEVEYAFSRAETMGQIMEIFEKYANRFGWGDLYIAANSEYRHGFETAEQSDRYSEKMSLVAVIDKDVPKENADPVTHVYEIFDTKELLPEKYREGKRLFNIFGLQSENICIGYLAVADSSETIEYNRIGSLNKLLVNAIENCRQADMMRSLNNKLKELYMRDPLTDLYNRFGLESRGKEFFNKLKSERSVTFWFVDIDNLKMINDKYGHRTGDEAIFGISKKLERIANIYGLFIMRYGGDEFLMFGSADADEIEQSIHDDILGLEIHYVRKGAVIAIPVPERIDVSVGKYVMNEQNNLSFEECIDRADKLMYKDKSKRKRGRN